MSLYLQIIISIWIIFTIAVIIGYNVSASNRYFTGLVSIITKSESLNLFGKIFLNILYILLCPFIAIIEWLIIAMTYRKGGRNDY